MSGDEVGPVNNRDDVEELGESGNGDDEPDSVYNNVVYQRQNIFKLTAGASGKAYIKDLLVHGIQSPT